MNLDLIALAIAILLPAVVWLVCHVRLQAMLQHQQTLTAQLESLSQQNKGLSRELNELRTGALGVAKRVKSLERALNETSERQQALELNDPDGKLYSRAVKMVELGADVEELVAECELPRAEAELLINLHRGRARS